MDQPEEVATEQPDITRLESHVAALGDEARVELVLHDGSRLLGTVAVRPTVQVFRGDGGREGINGRVRLDDDAGGVRMLWLTDIVAVTRYGSN